MLACSGGASSGENSTTILGVSAGDFAFTPSEARVKVNQRYLVRLTNSGSLLHDWTIDSIEAADVGVGASSEHKAPHADDRSNQLHLAADPGKTADLRFTPTRAGEYVFYCTVPGHRDAGMQGALVVEP